MKARASLRLLLPLSYILVVAMAALGTTLMVRPTLWQSFVRERQAELLNQGNIIAQAVRRELHGLPLGMQELVRSTGHRLGSRVLIVDAGGYVVADGQNELVGTHVVAPGMEAALKGRQSTVTGQVNGVPMLYVFIPVVHPEVAELPTGDGAGTFEVTPGQVLGVVYISRSLLDLQERQQDITRILLGVNAIIAALVIPMAIYFVWQISAPLTELTTTAELMASGALGATVRPAGNREIYALGQAFNIMSQRLAALEVSRRKFVADASHELRTPLASIKALLSPLVREEPAPPLIVRDFLKEIDHELSRLSHLVDDLLQLASLDNQQALELKTVNLTALIVKIVQSLLPLADQRAVAVSVRTLGAIEVSADEDKLHRALINIMDNAIKFAHSAVHIRAEQGEVVEVHVVDDGPGIPEDATAKLFERFYRVDQARARHSGGSGLGLAIAWEIISLHGGSIRVKSLPGHGTTFTVVLPLIRSDF